MTFQALAIVGYVTMQIDAETRIGWIHNLAVAANARGQGVGRRLIEHAVSHFRATGMTVAKIETARAEFDRTASLSVGRFCRNRPSDSLRNASFD